jgi:hypothetical protein
MIVVVSVARVLVDIDSYEGLNCAIYMRALLKLSHLVRTLIIDNIRLFLRNLVNLLMIALLGLSLS